MSIADCLPIYMRTAVRALPFGTSTESRKLDVIAAIVLNPTASNKEIADKVCCCVSTVRKWRPYALSQGVCIRGPTGTVRYRLRRDVQQRTK